MKPNHRLLLCLMTLFGAGCATAAGNRVADASSPPMQLSAQRVLVLEPLRGELKAASAAELNGLLLAAFTERAPDVTWVPQAELVRGLRRSPGYAPSPDQVAVGAVWNGRPRHVEDPLASQLRRYGALVNARLLLLLTASGSEDTTAPMRLHAVLLDSRSGAIVWRGYHEESAGPVSADLLSRAAQGLARRLLSEPAAPDEPARSAASAWPLPSKPVAASGFVPVVVKKGPSGPSVAAMRRYATVAAVFPPAQSF